MVRHCYRQRRQLQCETLLQIELVAWYTATEMACTTVRNIATDRADMYYSLLKRWQRYTLPQIKMACITALDTSVYSADMYYSVRHCYRQSLHVLQCETLQQTDRTCTTVWHTATEMVAWYTATDRDGIYYSVRHCYRDDFTTAWYTATDRAHKMLYSVTTLLQTELITFYIVIHC